jgi:hypothetical protein
LAASNGWIGSGPATFVVEVFYAGYDGATVLESANFNVQCVSALFTPTN